jgi:hypothetical protein
VSELQQQLLLLPGTAQQQPEQEPDERIQVRMAHHQQPHALPQEQPDPKKQREQEPGTQETRGVQTQRRRRSKKKSLSLSTAAEEEPQTAVPAKVETSRFASFHFDFITNSQSFPPLFFPCQLCHPGWHISRHGNRPRRRRTRRWRKLWRHRRQRSSPKTRQVHTPLE